MDTPADLLLIDPSDTLRIILFAIGITGFAEGKK